MLKNYDFEFLYIKHISTHSVRKSRRLFDRKRSLLVIITFNKIRIHLVLKETRRLFFALPKYIIVGDESKFKMPESAQTESHSQSTVYTGHVSEFNYTTSEFRIFQVKLTNFFAINQITANDLKRAFFLNALSENTYKLLETLCVPEKIECKKFTDLVKALEKHLAPVKSYFSARIKFCEA